MATIKLTNGPDYADNSDGSQAGYGNNTWFLLKGEDVLYGGSGRDTVYGAGGADYINGVGGNDTIYGDDGWDQLYGSDGIDTLYGGRGNDVLFDTHDGQHDLMFGGVGNDTICGDSDKIDAGAGNDLVYLYEIGGSHADVTLGRGSDSLHLDLHEHDWANYNQSRVDVRDFKANDTLVFDSAHDQNEPWFDHGTVLDRLDVNKDGWLGAKDVEAFDSDNVTVHVGRNFLELDVFDTSVVLHGMTKASFDFLS